VPTGWAIFAAGNRQGDRGVTYSMPAPLANRFSHFEFDTNLDDWVAWAYANGIDERVIASCAFVPSCCSISIGPQPGGLPSPRSWEFAHRALAKSAITRNCSPALCRPAWVRRPASTGGLRREPRQAPDIDAILRGDKVPVPREVDLQYAVAAALVGRAIRARDNGNAQETYGHIIDYAGSFPQREMGVMLISDMHRAIGQELFSVPQFAHGPSRLLM